MKSVWFTAPVASLLLLTGCITPQKVNQVRQDAAVYRAQESERDAYDRCSQTAIPGSMEHMACMAALTKAAGTPAK
jgi:hypothetical protein